MARAREHMRRGAPGLTRGAVHEGLSPTALCEEAVRRREGLLTRDGALACTTGAHTGRSPLDKFLVRRSETEAHVSWDCVNQPVDEAAFARLEGDVRGYLAERDVFVQHLAACADPEYRLPVTVVTELAWHGVFAANLLLPGGAGEPEAMTILAAPGFRCSPARHGTRSETGIVLDLHGRRAVVAGTAYAGEIKKSVFTALNYLLPFRGVLPMHCAANVGADGAVALFFGLSGTGKTTLSSDPARPLIGDDEHGWSSRGVFNLEGGCYAKTIRLSPEDEPQIAAATRRFGTVLENVVVDLRSRRADFDAATLTENTRAGYPLEHVPGHVESGRGGHPRDIVMLTADAFGVLPPIARLTPEQAMYHFLSGYTARVAGTERGVTQPAATFSACFAAPFLPLRPAVYASMLGRRIAEHDSRVWLVNTGWTEGPYGIGRRIRLGDTRRMVQAAVGGALDDVASRVDPVFGLAVPRECPGVDARVLDPRSTWRDASAYDAQARRLAAMFEENFAVFAPDVGPDVAAAGPRA